MAVYNGAQYVSQAVDSILAQACSDFEFIIADDGSTDDTPQILASYSDPRIMLLKNDQNLGLSRSLNRGLQFARGEYIARQDADDLSFHRRLAEQVAFLDAHPRVGVVGTTTEWIGADGEVLLVWRQPTDNPGIQETLLEYCCLVHGSTMYRHSAIQEAGGYDQTMRTGQDYDLWLRLSETWDLACLPDVLYRYRQHRGMASVGRREEQLTYADLARTRAVQRRKGYTRLALGLGRDRIPARLQAMNRHRLAQRYAWWSAGARAISRKLALQFLLAALLFDPAAPDTWSYISGILQRKTILGKG